METERIALSQKERDRLNIQLPQPHPAAEDLFGVAWSACYMGAIEAAASRKKIALPPGLAVDARIDAPSRELRA